MIREALSLISSALVLISFVVGFAGRCTGGGQKPVPPKSTQAASQHPYSFECSIDSEGYGFKIAGEAGLAMQKADNESKSFQYDAAGGIKRLVVIVNRELRYQESGHRYEIHGQIVVNHLAKTEVTYDVTATGATFGGKPQTCRSGPAMAPEFKASQKPVPAATPKAPISLHVPAEYAPAIAVPACQKQAAEKKLDGGTYLCMVSSGTHSIGEGKQWIHTPPDSKFSTEFGGGKDGTVTVRVEQSGQGWDLEFAPVKERGWAVGMHAEAERYPFQGPGRPGLSVTGHGRGCNTVSGRFEILELEFDPSARQVKRFAANFEESCDAERPLLGLLRINSSVAP